MYIYIIFGLLALIFWKLMIYVLYYRRNLEWASRIPGLKPSHWFWGYLKLAEDWKGLTEFMQLYIEKTSVKWFYAWNAFLYPILKIVHPQSFKAVLTLNNIPKNHGIAGPYRYVRPWLGDGLLTSNGKKWERNRRLLTPALHFNVLIPYIAIYHDVADILLKKLSTLGSGKESLNICPLISRATLDTMLRCTLSYESEGIQSTESDQHPYVKAVERLKALLMKRLINPFVYVDFIYSWTANCREFREMCDFVHNFSSDIIQTRKKALQEDPTQLDKRHLDFLDILITAKDEKGAGLTDQEIRDEVDTFMFAGHDTTSSVIMWVLNSLAKYPDMQKRVREDVQAVLQGRDRLQIEDLAKLNYTTCFIKESMRMYTPVPAISRKLSEPVTLEGVKFPSGTVIDLHPHLLHHHPDVWVDHAKFDPERFSPDNIAKKDPFAFIPFSAGQRNCIGQHFALNEIKTIVSRIVTRFEIVRDTNREAIPYPEVVMAAKDGIYLNFRDI